MRRGELIADRYRLEELIGTGGMGEVWRATDAELHREVALKHAGDGAQSRREARIGAGLSHPNIVTVFDVVRSGEGRLLVMEYLPSRNLAQIINADGALSPQQTAAIGAQIAAAIAAMHEKRMIHRDITPGNVLVAADGTAKLTDLGIALWQDVTETGAHQHAGTPGYIAPENKPTTASDVYTLGATLQAAVGDAPGRLRPVLAAMLHDDPAKRPTAARVRHMLLDVAEAPKRAFFLRAAAVVTGVAVAGVALWMLWPTPNPPQAETTTPIGTVGDPRSADPCGLADPSSLAKYGKAEVDSDYGNFDRCDLRVRFSNDADDYTGIRIELGNLIPGGPPPSKEVTVERYPLENNDCGRIIRMPDGFQVDVASRHNNDRQVDLCGMADAVADGVVRTLNRGAVPRRITPIDPQSLARLNACGLLSVSDVAPIMPVTGDPVHGFAEWSCEFGGSPDTLKVMFDRHGPIDEHTGTPIKVPGHNAYVEADGYGEHTCVGKIIYRTYTDLDVAMPAVELVLVFIKGDKPGAQYCDAVTRLTNIAASKLSH